MDRENQQYKVGQERESLVHNVCNANIKGNGGGTYEQPKCHLLHHFNPFCILGPFPIDVKQYYPLRLSFIDFYDEKEIDWMQKTSYEKISLSRSFGHINNNSPLEEITFKGVTQDKAITSYAPIHQISDIRYDENEKYTLISRKDEPPVYESSQLRNPYAYTILHKILLRISKRIEMATGLNVTTRHGSTEYSVSTNGLSGSLKSHVDPYGYEEGRKLRWLVRHLFRTGDYIATFMGWIDDTAAGGGTAFIAKHYEGLLEPKKGSAAFWINLSPSHFKDERSKHAGCPVLKGKKGIINKWIYSFDQWKQWPCKLGQNVTFSPFNGIVI